MAKHLITNPYNNVYDVRARFRDEPTPMKWSEWRLLQPAQVGMINGLPGTKGVAIATNGVLVIIDTGCLPFVGHLESFITEEGEEFTDPYGKKMTTTKKPKGFKLFTKFAQ
jgi:hypothetical protein